MIMDTITIYTKSDCSHCVAAKRYLTEQAIDFAEIDVMADADAIAFLRANGHHTVPQVYAGQHYLGDGQRLRTIPPERLASPA
jgi:glutaredoxin